MKSDGFEPDIRTPSLGSHIGKMSPPLAVLKTSRNYHRTVRNPDFTFEVHVYGAEEVD